MKDKEKGIRNEVQQEVRQGRLSKKVRILIGGGGYNALSSIFGLI